MSTGQYPGYDPQQPVPPQPYDAQQHGAPQQYDAQQQPGGRRRALPWIIVGAAVVVLAIAGIATWLLLAQSSAREGAVAAHERAAASYEEAWESLQEGIEEATLLLADAEGAEAADGSALDAARASLADAEAIERIDAERAEDLPGVAEIEADTARLQQAEEEIVEAEEALDEDFSELRSVLRAEIVAGLDEAIASARDAMDRAETAGETALAEGLSALIGEAQALIEDQDSTPADLRDVWDRLVAETDAVESAIVPRAEDIDGTWCAVESGECETIELPSGYSGYGEVTITHFGMTDQGCFQFTARPTDSPVGGYTIFYCPAGVAAGGIGDVPDRPAEDRIFAGQAYPMNMSVRQ